MSRRESSTPILWEFTTFKLQILYQLAVLRQDKTGRRFSYKEKKTTLRLEQMFYHMPQFRENEGLTSQLAGRQASGHTE